MMLGTQVAASSFRDRPPFGGLASRLLGTVSLLALIVPLPAHANPVGGNIVAGQVTLEDRGNGHLQVNQSSDKAIIDWQSFSIGAGERTHFAQPNSSAIALNRVVGADPSTILGRLSATGQLILVNPNGILFGTGSRVDVAGLIATTSDIANADFLAGRLDFSRPGSPDATVVNAGTITVAQQGLAALVAPGVENTGVIEARLGRVSLASGDRFTVDLFGDGLLQMATDAAPSGESAELAYVSNDGRITADGGRVLLTARAASDVVDSLVNMDGVIEARTVEQRDGEIILHGEGAGALQVAGRINASATDTGDGGRVILWADGVTDFSGEIAARGGADAGDGGFVEVSGQQRLSYRGSVDTSAAAGNTGTLLLDPTTINICNCATGPLTLGPTIEDNGGDAATSNLSRADLVAALVDNNVVVTTASNGAGSGDINVNTSVTWNSGNDLELRADRDINVNQNVRGNGAGADLTLNAGRNVSVANNRRVQLNGGAVDIDAGGDVAMAGTGSRIQTRGGLVDIDAESVTTARIITSANGAARPNGGLVDITARSGNITLNSYIDTRATNVAGSQAGAVNLTATLGNVRATNNGARILAEAGSTTGSGKRAGAVSVTAAGDIAMRDIRAYGRGTADNGGVVDLDAGGNLSTGRIYAYSTGVGGQAGTITTAAGDNATLGDAYAYATGASGMGAAISVTAGGNATTRRLYSYATNTNSQGASVSVQAAGSIDALSTISAASGSGNAGGDIALSSTGGSINTGNNATLSARGGTNGNGGSVSLAAANTVNVGTSNSNSVRIDTRGGLNNSSANGGAVTIIADTVNVRRGIDASAGRGGGQGGQVTVTARNGAANTRGITSRGGTQAGSSGTGGAVAVTGQTVSVGSTVNTRSGVVGGNGGVVALTASAGSATFSTVDTRAGTSAGALGIGGSVQVVGGSTITANGNITTSGGVAGGDGGAVRVTAPGAVSVRAITTRGRNAGAAADQGSVTVSGSAVTLRGNITTRGLGAGAWGGEIAITATAADLNMNRRLDSRGAAGNATTPDGGQGGSVSLTGPDVAINSDIFTAGGNAAGVNGDGGAAGAVTVNATSAARNVTLNRSLTVLAGGAATGTGTRGAGATVALNGNTSLQGSRSINTGPVGGSVRFAGTVNTAGGNRNLSVNSGTGTVTFDQGIGTIAGRRVRHVTVTAATTTLNDVTTQSNGRVTINGDTRLNADATINAAGSGYIRLNGRVDGTGAGGQALALQANTGTVRVGGPIGGNIRTGTVTVSSSNTTPFDLVDINTANADVTIGMRARVNGGARIDTGAGAGAISFAQRLDGATAGADPLTLLAGTGNVSFAAAVGASRRLGDVAVLSGDDVSIAAGLVGAATGLNASGALTGDLTVDSLTIGGGSATLTGVVNGQAGTDTAAEVAVNAFNVPNPCTVNGVACTLPPPPPAPPVPIAVTVTEPALPSIDVAERVTATAPGESPLPAENGDTQPTPGGRSFVQAPAAGPLPLNVFADGYRLVTNTAIQPASGDDNDEDDEAEAYFNQDLWAAVRAE